MAGEITSVDSKMIEILRAIQDGKNVPKPFEQEIFLLKTHIAGIYYYEAKKVSENLKERDYLIFQREAENKYDKLAIKILDLDKNKLGYLPREKNEIISRLMDSGKILYGVIDKKEVTEDYINISIKIFLKEI
jgi:hypothetical protein